MLGHMIKAGGGERDGEQVLDILAAHPSTARFIATKLARRFVSDDPPPALVDRAGGAVPRHRRRPPRGDAHLLTSPEFLSPGRVPREGEDAVRVRRQRGARDRRRPAATRRPGRAPLQQLGMPLYMCQPPTGYEDTAEAWVNTGALVNRMNFALQLAERPVARRSASRIVEQVLNNDVSSTTRETIARATTAEQKLALTLGSPEFQRR